MNPRVTLGVATYERDTYLEEAVASCLQQTYRDLEVLVVLDGGRNPAIDEVLARFDDPRLRIVRHEANRGIAEAYNTIVREARGELIAMLGDDDRLRCPIASRRQVAVFDRHPDTGVVHGAATVIDGAGVSARRLAQPRPFRRTSSLRHLCAAQHLVDPSRMVHRRVYEAVGGYDAAYPLARTSTSGCAPCARFRFRDVPGAPLIGFRRHGENSSDESARDLEVQEVERALRTLIDAAPLRELVPELDWGVMLPQRGRAPRARGPGRRLRVRAAGRFPGWRASCAPAPPRVPAPPRPAPDGRKIVMTAFGFNDTGGGTTVPRMAAKELARRGWDVTVFHAAVRPDRRAQPYDVREWIEDGVRLVGIHNRPHGPVRPRQPAARARRPADHRGLRGAAGSRARPTSCTSTTCTTSAPR